MAFNADGHSRSSAENAAALGSKHALRLLKGGNESSTTSNVRKSKASTKVNVTNCDSYQNLLEVC